MRKPTLGLKSTKPKSEKEKEQREGKKISKHITNDKALFKLSKAKFARTISKSFISKAWCRLNCCHKNLILMAREGLENPRGRQLMLNLPVICSKCYLIQYQNSHYALFSCPLDLLFFSPYLFYPVLSTQRINHRFTIFFHCRTKKTIAKNASSGSKFRRRACGKKFVCSFVPMSTETEKQ